MIKINCLHVHYLILKQWQSIRIAKALCKLKQKLKFHKIFLKYIKKSYLKSILLHQLYNKQILSLWRSNSAYILQYNTVFIKFAIINMFLITVTIIFKKET